MSANKTSENKRDYEVGCGNPGRRSFARVGSKTPGRCPKDDRRPTSSPGCCGSNSSALPSEGEYVSLDDFPEIASAGEIPLIRALGHIAREHGAADSGYRVLANSGPAAHQEVPHFLRRPRPRRDAAAPVMVSGS
jgi:hypothetical protein